MNDITESLAIKIAKLVGSEAAEPDKVLSGTSTQTGNGVSRGRGLTVPTIAAAIPLGGVLPPCRLAMINTHLTEAFAVDAAPTMDVWPQICGPGEILKLHPGAGTTVYWRSASASVASSAEFVALSE